VTILYKMVGSLLATAFILVFMILPMAMVYDLKDRYVGEVKFNTIQEAQDYQNDILYLAESMGASVRDANISFSSPPQFYFNIKVQPGQLFPHGRVLVPTGWILFVITTMGLAILGFILAINIIIWRS